MTDSTEDLQRQLKDVEEQIAQLGGDAADIPGEVGGQNEGALDPEEIAADLNNEEENDAILTMLRARRDSLRERLDAAG